MEIPIINIHETNAHRVTHKSNHNRRNAVPHAAAIHKPQHDHHSVLQEYHRVEEDVQVSRRHVGRLGIVGDLQLHEAQQVHHPQQESFKVLVAVLAEPVHREAGYGRGEDADRPDAHDGPVEQAEHQEAQEELGHEEGEGCDAGYSGGEVPEVEEAEAGPGCGEVLLGVLADCQEAGQVEEADSDGED